eukprot:91161_1
MDITMDNISFDSCKSVNGGAVYFSFCPAGNNTNILFKRNSAEHGGGAMMNDDECAIEWCTNCNYTKNIAAYGNNISSPYPDLIDINFNIASRKVHQSLPLNIEISLYDEYRQLMKSTSYAVEAIVNFNESSKLKLVGIYNQTITDGHAILSFQIKPKENIKYTNHLFNVNLTLAVITPFNITMKHHEITFYNEVYKSSNWFHVQSYIMFAVILVHSIFITHLVIKNRNHHIIKDGIPIYLCTVLTGTYILSFLMVLLPHIPDSVAYSCQIAISILHLSFILIIGPLAGKTIYIWKVTFLDYKTFKGFNKTKNDLKWMTFGSVILPLIVSIAYLIYWMIQQNEWTKWHADPNTGVNLEFCVVDDAFKIISCAAAIVVLLLLSTQISLSINDKNDEYNTKTIIIITVLFFILLPFIIFDLVTDEAKKIIICIGCFISILLIQGCIFWTQFYLIWLQNSYRRDTTSIDCYQNIDELETNILKVPNSQLITTMVSDEVVHQFSFDEIKTCTKELTNELFEHKHTDEEEMQLQIDYKTIRIKNVEQDINDLKQEWNSLHPTYESKNHLSIRGRQKCLNKKNCHSFESIKFISEYYHNWLHVQMLKSKDKICNDINSMNNDQALQFIKDLLFTISDSCNYNDNIDDIIEQNNGKDLISLITDPNNFKNAMNAVTSIKEP